ncbi:hypothetical protein LZK75_10040 [Rhizobium leguminosarum]|nr:hypothetical protein LZK75_10040 [Rhizobium leguminosarum]
MNVEIDPSYIEKLCFSIALAAICLGAVAALNVGITRNTISRADLQISDGVEKKRVREENFAFLRAAVQPTARGK